MIEQSISLVLSGGGTNLAVNASLGGQRSVYPSALVYSQGASPASPFSGVTIVDARGHTVLGTGTLAYTASTETWTYTPPGGSPVSVHIPVSGRSRIGAVPCLIMDVDVDALPAVDQSVPVVVYRRQHNLFDPVPYSERNAGRTEYRCVYVRNEGLVPMLSVSVAVSPAAALGSVTLSPGDSTAQWSPLSSVQVEALQSKAWDRPIATEATLGTQLGRVFRKGQPFYGAAPPVVSGADGDGISTAVAAGPLMDEVDSTNLLAGYVWSSSVTMGPIAPGNVRPLWIRRLLPPDVGSAPVQETIGLQVAYTARG